MRPETRPITTSSSLACGAATDAERELQLDTDLSRWYALYVQVRHEKTVGAQIELRGIPCYVPLYEAVRRWSDRKTVVSLPLFPGYIFVRVALSQANSLTGIRGAVSLVGFGNKPSPIPDEQIATLQAALSARASIPVPYFPTNTPVRILAGPLAGLEGVVMRDKGKSRMVVSLDMIMRSVSVELDPLDLERLELPSKVR